MLVSRRVDFEQRTVVAHVIDNFLTDFEMSSGIAEHLITERSEETVACSKLDDSHISSGRENIPSPAIDF